MIIQCDRCGTAFEHQDDWAVPRGGTPVRCLTCGHDFRVQGPSPEADETAAASRPPEEIDTGGARRGMRRRLMAGALLLLVLALAFNVLLSLSSLENLYVRSLVSKYSVVGKDLKRNLEKALRFGKNIEKFVGMDRLLAETRGNLVPKRGGPEDPGPASGAFGETVSGDLHVSIAAPDGRVLYTTDDHLRGTILPVPVRKGDAETGAGEAGKELRYARHGGTYFITIPVQGGFRKAWVGTVVITFHERQVNDLLARVLRRNLITIGAILAGGALLLVILLKLVTAGGDGTGPLPKLRISLVLFLVVGITQIIFTGFNTELFRNYYLRINQEKTAMLADMLREDIEYFLKIGRPIDRLTGLDAMLGEIIEASPELENITIFDDEGRPLYIATKDGVTDFQEAIRSRPKLAHEFVTRFDEDYNHRLTITRDEKVQGYVAAEADEGYISTNLSKRVIYSQLREIILDSVTVLVISLLFFVEVLILVFQFIDRRASPTAGPMGVQYGAIRPAAFLFLFGIDISISFIPLHMERLYEPFLGLSKDMVIGLPISAEMFCAGLSILIAGAWVDRRGWHEPFFTGLLLAGLGFLYSWIAPDALHFIISRGLIGLGYGFSLMAAQGFTVAHTDHRNKAQGLSQLFAGVYAGSICGGATGAMLAERVGYRPVFVVGAAILFSVIAYTLIFMRSAIARPEPPEAVEQEADGERAGDLRQVLRFLANPSVLSLSFLSIVPAAVAVVGFLNYFSPIYLNRIGASQSNIGRIFMIYGVCLIYVGPFISRYVDESDNKKSYIVLSGVLGSMAFMLFYYFGGLATTAMTVLLLGLSSAFGFASQNAYALKLPVTEALGAGKAIGILSSMERAGQVVGPLLFGWLVATQKLNQSVTYFGIAYLAVTILCLVSLRRDTPLADPVRTGRAEVLAGEP